MNKYFITIRYQPTSVRNTVLLSPSLSSRGDAMSALSAVPALSPSDSLPRGPSVQCSYASQAHLSKPHFYHQPQSMQSLAVHEQQIHGQSLQQLQRQQHLFNLQEQQQNHRSKPCEVAPPAYFSENALMQTQLRANVSEQQYLPVQRFEPSVSGAYSGQSFSSSAPPLEVKVSVSTPC